MSDFLKDNKKLVATLAAVAALSALAAVVYYVKTGPKATIEDAPDSDSDEDLKKKKRPVGKKKIVKKGKVSKKVEKEESASEEELPTKVNKAKKIEKPIEKEEKKDTEPVTAEDFRKKGNMEFTNRNYDEAIQLYTKAIDMGDQNAHFLYSNRSAAYLFKGDVPNAMNDALQCNKLKPDWAKGYFRLGKAQLADAKYDEAYTTFYKGFLLDLKKNEELEVLLRQCASYLSSCDKDSRTYVERESVKLYIKNQMEAVCKNTLGTNYQSIVDTVKKAVDEDKVTALAADPTLEPLVEQHEVKHTE